MASKLNSLTRWLRDYRVLSRYRAQWILACLFLLLAAAATLAVPLAFRGVVDTGLTSDAIDLQLSLIFGNAILKTYCGKAPAISKLCKPGKSYRG